MKGLASYCYAETTFTYHISISILSNAFLSINNREMKSESGFSLAIASQPFQFCGQSCFNKKYFYRTGSRWKIRSTDLFTWSASGGPSEKSLQTRWTSDHIMLVVKRTKRNNKGTAVVSFFVDSCHQLQLQKQGTPYARCEVKV